MTDAEARAILTSDGPPANTSEIPNSSDTISRAKAIDGKICIRRSNGVEIYDDYVVPVEYLEQLPPAQPNITHIIMETLAECGIYGEEATIKLIGTLKRIGRDDLLPPCER